jgi:hypothetical protein
MPDETKRESAARRIKVGLISLAACARVREELILKRLTTPSGEQSERLEDLLHVNEVSMDETRKSLWQAEDDLLREIGEPG